MWHILLWWLFDARHISFRFSVKYRFPFPILRFFKAKSPALLKDRFLKKVLLKTAKPCRLFFFFFFFFRKFIGSNNSFTVIKHNLGFQDSEVWIQGNSTL